MKYFKGFWFWLRLAIPAILIAIGIVLNGYAVTRWLGARNPISSPSAAPTISEQLKASPSPTPSVAPPPITPAPTASSLGEPKFGHFPYAEADSEEMVVIASYAQGEYQRFERLAPEAALALMKLIYAARDKGVWIVPVSGWRTIDRQEELFKAQVERKGSPEAAAKLSAPPGYSEHHTGYAIDLTDGGFPKQDITYKFAETDAFRWLSKHASEFGFEMSFSENNFQGISYEPWHWRFVGSPDARQVFARANIGKP